MTKLKDVGIVCLTFLSILSAFISALCRYNIPLAYATLGISITSLLILMILEEKGFKSYKWMWFAIAWLLIATIFHSFGFILK